MRSTLEEEDELAPVQTGQDRVQDRELTLSSTTLLAIFFGLVLICALFFAIGYTLGRRSPSEASQSAASGPAAPQSYDSQPKPSAAAQTPAAAVPAPSTTDPQTADLSDGSGGTAADSKTAGASSPEPALKDASAETKSGGEAAALSATPQAAGSTGSAAAGQAVNGPAATGIMVQVAAVSNPADADVLVSALHKRGYSVTVRRDAADSLMHVQVGPFSSRADAVAMRQKLLADGYNAILK